MNLMKFNIILISNLRRVFDLSQEEEIFFAFHDFSGIYACFHQSFSSKLMMQSAEKTMGFREPKIQ